MSIWMSIPGDDPLIFEGEEANYLERDGWMDVAVCTAMERARLLICDGESEVRIALDPDGLAELHRRIVRARIEIDRRARWKESRQL